MKNRSTVRTVVRSVAFWSALAGSTRLANAAENPWASLLKRDLDVMRDALLQDHPGSVDTLNAGFASWLDRGYRQALDRASRCESYEGYRFALEAYATGFRDGHLALWTDLRREGARWPGFLVGWRSEGRGKLLIRVVGEGKAGEGAPTLGSEVVACDGVPARALLERDVFPFMGDPAFEWGWDRAAPQLLVDEANPWRAPMPRRCTIRDGKEEREHLLQWREISYQALRAHQGAVLGRPKLDFVTRPFGERGIWVGLPSFSATNETTKAGMETAIERAPSWRDRDPIVFDVRTNGGGSSIWGKKVLQALYGEAFVDSRYEPRVSREYVEWRVSPGNLQYLKTTILSAVIRVSGLGSPGEASMRGTVASVERALAEGKTVWRETKSNQAALLAGAPSPLNPVRGRVFLLTDGECASACLDFADMIRFLPGTAHVGRTTAGDSVYMEGRAISLPSRVATLVVPIKVYRNRPRGNNEPYAPHHAWKGDIADTAALERWILSLPPRR